MADQLPLDWLLVLGWTDARGELAVLAEAGELPAGLVHRHTLPTPRATELRAWGLSGRVTRWLSRGETALGRALIPEALVGPCSAIPLPVDGALRGVLLAGGALDRADAELLREPFTVAFGNDLRLHELARLKEAAEADRQALLQRLGREGVTDVVVGAQGGLREVMARVEQVARTDAPVLVLGETGSGKELVAREIHHRSPRSRGPFLRVNCGAIPPELVDSELFGHERGAFTGAVSRRQGWFERADGGTLFLDEVGELPAAAQVRLLRVLQDGAVQRVGGEAPVTVDVRIVTATHRDLHALQEEGSFRRDLWYRISVFPIEIPPLRDRRADVPALVTHFAERAGMRLFGLPLHPTEHDLDVLCAYAWPGNVRELAAVVERAAILGDGERLDVARALGTPSPSGRTPLPAPPRRATEESTELEQVLRRSHGRIEGPFGAAAALGVNPATLRSRLRRLGIDWTRYRPGR
ncbi:MAG: sigma-54-dependent Fis family transcriptional regulator [Alphaproteobacteria bacterium]|nr:sigma-54-dependent Fis family transcriptional regulator [Alphaproteobacteria bacterium]MCB9697755.1 sigma-54-dependent Fis family transcriptional regulator [Alphaproteobacteria bacterium]